MRICIAHNRYQQAGGEDRVVAAEAAMLRRHGHTVELIEMANGEIHSVAARAAAAVTAFFSVPAYRHVKQVLTSFEPEILHVHNFMAALSPAVFYAAASTRTPVVQTLHNYRLLCANAELFREGSVCERCIDRQSFLPGVLHGCYRGSRTGSAVVGGTMALHDAAGTWRKQIARYIALTSFAAEKLGGYRIPRERIRVKPNFADDRGMGEGGGGYALFVGRWSPEKGIDTLLAADAAGLLPMPVYLAGDGPMREQVQRASVRPGSQLVPLGPQSSEQILAWMQRAEVLLVPSLWFEGFPMVVVEAFAVGLPVLASQLGSLQEIVEDGRNGLLFPPGSEVAMASSLHRFLGLDGAQKAVMRAAARGSYLADYNETKNLQCLVGIYDEAIREAQTRCN